jgi:hypothetical protein
MPAYKYNTHKKENWISRLKKGVQSVMKGPGHSKAGKKYVKKQTKGGKFVYTKAEKIIQRKMSRTLTKEERKSLGI